MTRILNPWAISLLSLAAIAALLPTQAHAQYYYQPAPVPVISNYYVPPAVSYYAPTPSYYAAPAVSYYAPTYVSPAVNYSYYPSTAYVAPGAYTTRSYYGYGILRPRGVYTQSYYSPYWR